eukprot:1036477-Amphidinium_carterae.2
MQALQISTCCSVHFDALFSVSQRLWAMRAPPNRLEASIQHMVTPDSKPCHAKVKVHAGLASVKN